MFFVRGRRVEAFYAIIAGAGGSFVTPTGGIATFTRVYYDRDRGFDVGDGWGRTVAGEQFRRGDWDPVNGLIVRSDRYALHVPAEALRVTWRLPTP